MKKIVFIILFAGIISSPAFAWTPKTHEEIASDALTFVPKYLRIVLEKNKEQLLFSARGPEEDTSLHYKGWNIDFTESRLPKKIQKLSNHIVKMFKKNRTIDEICYSFGALSYYVAQVGNPLNCSNDDMSELYYYGLFDAYTEKNLQKFRIAFRGHDRDLMESGNVCAYLERMCQDSNKLYKQLTKAFIKDGKVQSIDTFSHFSIPFAVASLSYARSVIAVANVWSSIWVQMGGDEQMPNFKRKSEE